MKNIVKCMSDAIREKYPKRPSCNFRGERTEQESGIDQVSDITDSLFLQEK